MVAGEANSSEMSEGRFERALEAFEVMVSREAEDVAEQCGSQLLHHDRPTSHAYLLLHGFTNCPAQYARIAESLHAGGANVLSPLAQGHGRADGSPHALSDLTADGLARWTAEMVEMAAALGDRLTIVGFSFGGVCAAWAARNYDEVAEVVLLSPAYLPRGYPLRAARLLTHLLRVLPERYLWWDPVRRERMITAPYAYPRLSSHGIGSVFELGQIAWHSPATRVTELERVVLVINEGDVAISRPAARRSFEDTLVPLAAHAEVHHLAFKLHYPHDYIDPLGPISSREPETRVRVLEVIGFEGEEGAPRSES
jgi:pimeloyl-ACP methyl ester carboxylesterase